MNPFFRVLRVVVVMLAVVLSLVPVQSARAQSPVLLPNTMSTAAGNVHALDFGATTFPFGFTADGAAAVGSTLNYPYFVGVDPKGEVYFHDGWSAVIRQIDDSGNLKTVAGTVPAAGCAPTNSGTAGATYSGTLNGVTYTAVPYCWNDGPATSTVAAGNASHNVTGATATSSGFGMGYPASKLAGPSFDSYGNMYISESQNFFGVSVVYRGGAALGAFLATLYPGQTITPGNAYLLTGGATSGYTANGTAALSAKFKAPGTVGVDSSGNIYIPDENGFIQVLNIQTTAITVAGTSIPAGSVSTILGDSCVNNSGCTQISPANNVMASSSTNGTAGADAVTVDRWGNIYIANKATGSTGAALVAAIYAGAPNAVNGAGNPLYGMLNAIYPGLGTPSQNFTYVLSGNGATTPSVVTSPITSWVIGAPNATLGGTAVGLSHGNIQGLAVDGAGNVYFTDTTRLFVWRIDAVNGETEIVAGGGSRYSLASASFPTTQRCETVTGSAYTVYASSSLGDGCETTGIVIYGGNYGVATGPAGDVYFTQGAADVVEKLAMGTSFPATAVGATAAAQRIRIHFYASNLYAATSAFAIAGLSSTEFAFSVTPTPATACGKNADGSFDCVVSVSFKPAGAGLRQAQLVVTDASAVAHSFPLSGLGTGAQVTFDAGLGTNVATGLTAAAGVAVDGAGTVYATDTAASTLYRTKAGTTTAFATAASFSAPHQAAVDAAGDVYVADTGNNRVEMVTPQGTASVVALQGATLNAPQGVAIDRVGDLYIADTGNARVVMQPANGAYATRTVSTGSVTLSKPTALALDQAGNLFVLDAGLDEVVEFPQAQQGLNYVEANPAGATPVIYKSNALTSPQGIVVDPAGSVYVSDSVANTVFVFAAGSSSPVMLIPTGLSAPASSLSAPSGWRWISPVICISQTRATAACLRSIAGRRRWRWDRSASGRRARSIRWRWAHTGRQRRR